jgi:oligopeptide/dipeptide ABC transporter ATP-binding protein
VDRPAGQGGSPLLEVHDLDVEIPLPTGRLHAVRGVSLTASKGEAVGLVGESGSGKSLTLRAVMDLLPVHLSSVMAMIFQDALTALNPTMRVGDQVAEVPLRRLGMSRADAHARALDLLGQVGIKDPERRYRAYPHELSGGMRQRICIAIALSTDPGLILADEPTTALDVTIQAQVLGVLAELRQNRGVGLVLVTHDLAVVSGTCSRLSVMYGGRIVETGTTEALLHAPRMPYTAALLRSVPDPDQPVHRLLTIAGSPPDLLVDVPGCPFAPRCPAVVDRCTKETPPLAPVSPGRASACWRSHEPEAWPTALAEAATGKVRA